MKLPTNRELASLLRASAQYAINPAFKEKLRKDALKLFGEQHVSPQSIRSSMSAGSNPP